MTAWFAPHALLPDGLAHDVRLEVSDGRFTLVRPDSLADGASRLPGVVLPSLPAFGRLSQNRRSGELMADANARGIEVATRRRITDMWARAVGAGFISSPAIPTDPDPAVAAAVAAAGASRNGGPPTDIFGEYADLGMQLNARLEAKAERNKNERCSASQAFNPISNCSGTFQPQFDFQFNVKTGGVVADRVHVNVDYDSEREFDASNNISVYYEGKSDELVHRLEVGNVSFQPPPSRFITAGIPSGNYGLQAIGQLGPMRFRTIVAQQKGNVVKDRIFSVGDRTLQSVDRDVEDYQVEPRRFFFVIDPRQLGVPFDSEGTPKRRVALVEAGTVVGPVYDRRGAKAAGAESTGHAADPERYGRISLAGSLVMQGGTATREELIAAVGRGILITRFHYTNTPDPVRATMTGTTRDGTFLIEDGKIVRALANVRYTMGALDLFAGIDLLGPQRVVRDWWSSNGMGNIVCLAPAMKVSRATVTGSSPA